MRKAMMYLSIGFFIFILVSIFDFWGALPFAGAAYLLYKNNLSGVLALSIGMLLINVYLESAIDAVAWIAIGVSYWME